MQCNVNKTGEAVLRRDSLPCLALAPGAIGKTVGTRWLKLAT